MHHPLGHQANWFTNVSWTTYDGEVGSPNGVELLPNGIDDRGRSHFGQYRETQSGAFIELPLADYPASRDLLVTAKSDGNALESWRLKPARLHEPTDVVPVGYDGHYGIVGGMPTHAQWMPGSEGFSINPNDPHIEYHWKSARIIRVAPGAPVICIRSNHSLPIPIVQPVIVFAGEPSDIQLIPWGISVVRDQSYSGEYSGVHPLPSTYKRPEIILPATAVSPWFGTVTMAWG